MMSEGKSITSVNLAISFVVLLAVNMLEKKQRQSGPLRKAGA